MSVFSGVAITLTPAGFHAGFLAISSQFKTTDFCSIATDDGCLPGLLSWLVWIQGKTGRPGLATNAVP